MNTSNHLLVLSQSDFIERQLWVALDTTSKQRGRSWLRLFHR
jgi:hypothetical protein